MRRALALLCLGLLALGLAACGGGAGGGAPGSGGERPPLFGGSRDKGGGDTSGGGQPQTPASLGFPAVATKNTTRVAGSDPAAVAAGVALAVFPGRTPGTRPAAVTLADGSDWRAATAAAALMAPPVRAPLLLSDGTKLPDSTRSALETLSPAGSRYARRAQVISVGVEPDDAGGRRVALVGGKTPAAIAASVDKLLSAARGKPATNVVVVGEDDPEFGVPAAAWAAKSGDPVLFVKKNSVPAATRATLAQHGKPRIYVLGPEKTVGPKALSQLQQLGTVTRVGGKDPVTNAIAFASSRDFLWGVRQPGHGLVFAPTDQPLDGPAGAALASTGTYGPLLLLPSGDRLVTPVANFLLDIQPGYRSDPAREAVYNHGWILGDEKAVPVPVQARIDELLEPAPISKPTKP